MHKCGHVCHLLVGGEISGHAYGTWNIPPLIRDEESFRLDRLNRGDASAMAIR